MSDEIGPISRARAVVSDDGTRMRLTVYPAGVAEPLAVVELSLDGAAHLIADLAAAAARHLGMQRNHRIGVRRE